MVRVSEIARFLGLNAGAVTGDPSRELSAVGPITEATGGHVLTFCDRRGEEAVAMLRSTLAGAVICSSEVSVPSACDATTFIAVRDPRLAFVRAFRQWFAPPPPEPGVHPTACVSRSASIHPTAHIGPFCFVGNSVVGAESILHGHNHIGDRVRIGTRVSIQAGAVIGMDGFGYQPTEADEWEKWPHIGGVSIGDDVEIGANACIDRGCLGDTVIEEGAKVGNLAQIAHNCHIEPHAVILTHVALSGSCFVGRRTWIASHAAVMHRVRVGRNATVGMCALVRHDVPDGATVAGVPARELPQSGGFARPTGPVDPPDCPGTSTKQGADHR